MCPLKTYFYLGKSGTHGFSNTRTLMGHFAFTKSSKSCWNISWKNFIELYPPLNMSQNSTVMLFNPRWGLYLNSFSSKRKMENFTWNILEWKSSFGKQNLINTGRVLTNKFCAVKFGIICVSNDKYSVVRFTLVREHVALAIYLATGRQTNFLPIKSNLSWKWSMLTMNRVQKLKRPTYITFNHIKASK